MPDCGCAGRFHGNRRANQLISPGQEVSPERSISADPVVYDKSPDTGLVPVAPSSNSGMVARTPLAVTVPAQGDDSGKDTGKDQP